jgi:hypothetical protein
MTVGVWIAPAVLAGVVGLLGLACWLERVVAPRTLEHQIQMADIGTAVEDVSGVAASMSRSCHPADHGTPHLERGTQLFTSELERSS